MLVISRKADQSLQIGHDVTVQVVEIRGDRVRLGITAPGWMRINRREVQSSRDGCECTGRSSDE